jgi:hypothetical protein
MNARLSVGMKRKFFRFMAEQRDVSFLMREEMNARLSVGMKRKFFRFMAEQRDVSFLMCLSFCSAILPKFTVCHETFDIRERILRFFRVNY